MSYQKVNWLNKGETGAKYINKTNLNQMDNGIYNLDLNKVEVIQLLTVGDTAPVECERGDKYYDTTDELIYTATTTDTWGTEGETPLSTRLYVDLSSSKLYYYDGTNFDSYGGGGGGDSLPVGTIFPFSGNTLPSGYMICDGSAISRTTYSTLFGIIGTTYGVGDGSTTFNLPNLKGKVPVGYDSTDSDFDTLGETGGEKTHTLTVEEMPSHNHALYGALTGETKNITNTGNDWAQTTTSFSTDTYINNAGGGQAHNNLQPYIVINYIIKVSQTTSTQAQVVDGYSTSTTDSYSCDYVNGMNTYSTDEIRIGTWIDGKPIYRKVVARNITATNGTNISLSSLNIDELLKVKSINKKVSNNFTFYDNFFDSSNEKITLHYRNDIIEFWTATGTNYTSTVWIEYTKTTD